MWIEPVLAIGRVSCFLRPPMKMQEPWTLNHLGGQLNTVKFQTFYKVLKNLLFCLQYIGTSPDFLELTLIIKLENVINKIKQVQMSVITSHFYPFTLRFSDFISFFHWQNGHISEKLFRITNFSKSNQQTRSTFRLQSFQHFTGQSGCIFQL